MTVMLVILTFFCMWVTCNWSPVRQDVMLVTGILYRRHGMHLGAEFNKDCFPEHMFGFLLFHNCGQVWNLSVRATKT